MKLIKIKKAPRPAGARLSDERLAHDRSMMCNRLSFGGAEAYKLLRANLLFSLPDEKKCRVIGVTSANPAEGKSITAVNLAYTFAQTGKRVLLLEADMRLPNIAKRLGMERSPGLSNLLAGLSDTGDALRHFDGSDKFDIIPAGDVPPNPSELLGSEAMSETMGRLAGMYDFIIVDLPPINVVSDALVLSGLVDGFILVVRQDRTAKKTVFGAVGRLAVANGKFLGFVLNQASAKGGAYKYKYGKKYGYGGKYYSYSSSYRAAE